MGKRKAERTPRITLSARGILRLKKYVGKEVELRFREQTKGIKALRGRLLTAETTANNGMFTLIEVPTRRGEEYLVVKRHYVGGAGKDAIERISPAVFARADLSEQEIKAGKNGKTLRVAVQWPVPPVTGGEDPAYVIEGAIHRAALARAIPEALGMDRYTVSDVRLDNGAHIAPHDATVDNIVPSNLDLEIEELLEYARRTGSEKYLKNTLAHKLITIARSVKELDPSTKKHIFQLARQVQGEHAPGHVMEEAYYHVTNKLAKTDEFWEVMANIKRNDLYGLKSEVGNLVKTRAIQNAERTIALLRSKRIKDWKVKVRMLAELERNLSSLQIIAFRNRIRAAKRNEIK